MRPKKRRRSRFPECGTADRKLDHIRLRPFEKERHRMSRKHQESLDEFRSGRLGFSDDVDEVRGMLGE